MNTQKMCAKARQEIDDADIKIIGILSEFGLASTNEQTSANARNNKAALSSVMNSLEERHLLPQMLIFLTKQINLGKFDESETIDRLKELASHIERRIEAVVPVVIDKKANGNNSSYAHERHQEVIENAQSVFSRLNGNAENIDREKIAEIYESLTEYFVEIQAKYLNNRGGPLSDYIENNRETLSV